MSHHGVLPAKSRAGLDGRRASALSLGGAAPPAAHGQRMDCLRQGRALGAPRADARARVDESSEVFMLLKDIGLEQFAAHFSRIGVDDLNTLAAMDDADMKDLGLSGFHALRLRRRVLDGQRQRGRALAAVDPNHPVVLFLEEVGLGQYAQPLLRSGFDEMEILCEIEDSDMKDAGLPRGHALKLRRRLRDYQLQQYLEHEPCPPPASMSLTIPSISRVRRMAGSHIPASIMSMAPTEQMKSAVELSWEQVQSLGTCAVAEKLYRHTFTIMPEAVHLFPSHVRMKYREWSLDESRDESDVYDSPALRKLFGKFINAVGCAVAGLHDDAKLVSMLVQLGGRHRSYGVHMSHFQALGKAFSLTLADILGLDFTQEVEAAWTMAYNFMSSIMMEGLRGAAEDKGATQEAPQDGEKPSESAASTGQISDDISDSGMADAQDGDSSSAGVVAKCSDS